MRRRLLCLLLTLGMLLSLIPALSANATTTINIGDYVQMGRYYDEPILWRCVDIDENGPLMLADRILTFKEFDASGNHTYADGTAQEDNDGHDRTQYGSNLWETSNIRCWLNSTATAGNVTWLDSCPPIADDVDAGYNAYADEKGFLAEGNFTASEQNAIKSVTQKSLLNVVDYDKLSIGGTYTLPYDFDISTVANDYDKAYYHYVTDRMFLLDVKQLNEVYLNSNILGYGNWFGYPTQKAIDKSGFKDMSASNSCDYWIRTPDGYLDCPGDVLYVNTEGNVFSAQAKSSDSGIMPAFYLNLSSAIFKSGSGWKGTPFIMAGGNIVISTPTPTVKNTSTLPNPPKFDSLDNNDKTIRGSAKAGDTITIISGTKKLGTAKVNSEGKFVLSIKPLVAGTKVQGIVINKFGSISSVAIVTVKDAIPPVAPKVNAISSKAKTVKGKTETLATVTVKVGAKKLGTVTADNKGYFTVKITSQKSGTVLSVTATDKSGNTSKVTKVKVRK